MSPIEINDAIKPLLKGVVIPPTRSGIVPAHGIGLYRGKTLRWVGYHWSRPYSHFMTGLVHDARLAWGETYEEALAALTKKADSGAATV